MITWIDEELKGLELGDFRLKTRMASLLSQLSQFYAAALTKNLSICGSFIRLDFRS